MFSNDIQFNTAKKNQNRNRITESRNVRGWKGPLKGPLVQTP